ncbi:contractile injection system protein, VgrG/Pvc8 family [Hymenobacter sp.]|uniref:type VI secretion system Vgr family protein n=1 Tax=Hymenobacter sp. TaxID=1898978 RepID=UPI00286BC2AD|nr:contractile injection system protein, VgrG/Pvc8 family [Hymenobacter sp.]
MARQVVVTVQCAGQTLAPGQDFTALQLHQTLFDHHSLSIVVPFDSVEGSQAAFLNEAPSRFLGQPVTVAIEPDKAFGFDKGAGFHFKGLVTEMGTSQDSDGDSSITVQGYSACCLLAGGVQKRTFIKQTLKSIFEQVLKPYSGNLLTKMLQPRHAAPIPYVAQYKESDFAFLSRLATEYAEWFYYDGSTLRLGPPTAAAEVEFVADGVHNNFHLGLSLNATKVKFYEYNYKQHQHYTASTQAQAVPTMSQHPFGKLVLSQSDQLFSQESHTLAEVAIQSGGEITEEAKAFKAQRVADLVALQGSSDNSSLQLGSVIHVRGKGLGSNHVAPADFGAYRIVEVTHRLDAEGNYNNSFTAIPHLLELPPLNPHYAPPGGVQELAEVIDTQDPDHLGRVRVRYYWPVAEPKYAESDWLRTLTPYSGDGKGQLFVPEIGSQVLVGHENGLAESPVVLGNLFHSNNKQKAKYTTDSNYRKGLQTAGGNKVVLMDTPGAQTIHLSNSNNKGTAVEVGFKGDGSITIKSNGPVTVLSPAITLEAGEKGTIKLHAKTITMDADEEFTLSSKSKSISLKAKENISADATEKMDLKAKSKTITTTNGLAISGGTQVDIKAGKVKVNS